MKVLQVNKLYYPWIGGVEKHVQDISENMLPYADIDLTVVVCSDSAGFGDEVINGVKVKKLTNTFFKLFHKTLIFSMPFNITLPYWMRTLAADIIHIHLPNPWAVLAYWLCRPRGQVIVTWHSDIIKQKRLMMLYGPLERWFLNRVNNILVTSPNMIKYSKQLAGYQDKCIVVPLGIDPARFINTLQPIAKNIGKLSLLFVGRLVYYKGVSYLIEAMKDVSADLLIIGDGPLKEELAADISRFGLSDRVKIIPPVSESELVMYFQSCDVFVLPSIAASEAFGIVQLEAMACGKPVVSTNLPTGVPFVNEDGKTGVVVEPADAGALAVAINMLLRDDELRIKLGEYARTRVLSTFTNKQVAARVRDIYYQYFQNPVIR